MRVYPGKKIELFYNHLGAKNEFMNWEHFTSNGC